MLKLLALLLALMISAWSVEYKNCPDGKYSFDFGCEAYN